MKKLLILGASAAQIPFIDTAKKLGCHVGIVDYNKKAAAIEFADEYFQCSLTDIEGVSKVADIFSPDGITCGASDAGVITAAIICEKRGLPGMTPETAYKVKDKGTMIEAFRSHNIAHPEYQVVNSADEEIRLEFPLITKPVDNSGSRGINVARNYEELKASLKYSFSCSHINRVIVEEYMDGPEVSVELLIQDGKPHAVQVTDKMTTGEPRFIEVGHSQPSMLAPDDVKAIRQLACDAAIAAGIKDGCGHAEIKLTSKGPKMVEIAGRLGGDFIATKLVQFSTGINMSEYEILRAIGAPKKFTDCNSPNRGAAVRFIQVGAGKLESVKVDYKAEALVGIEEIQFFCKSEEAYSTAENNNDRFGYVIATGESAQIALDRCNKAMSCISIDLAE